MPPRDELLLIVELTPTLLRAGVGVHDVIRLPTVEVSTRLGRKRTNEAPAVTDYLAGPILTQAEAAGEALDIILPLSSGKHGFQVDDWMGLEALLFVLLHPSPTRTDDSSALVDTFYTFPFISLDRLSRIPSSSPCHRNSPRTSSINSTPSSSKNYSFRNS